MKEFIIYSIAAEAFPQWIHNEVVDNVGIHNVSEFFEPEKQNRIAYVHTQYDGPEWTEYFVSASASHFLMRFILVHSDTL